MWSSQHFVVENGQGYHFDRWRADKHHFDKWVDHRHSWMKPGPLIHHPNFGTVDTVAVCAPDEFAPYDASKAKNDSGTTALHRDIIEESRGAVVHSSGSLDNGTKTIDIGAKKKPTWGVRHKIKRFLQRLKR